MHLRVTGFAVLQVLKQCAAAERRLGLEQLDLLEKQAPAHTSDSASFQNCSAVNVKEVWRT